MEHAAVGGDSGGFREEVGLRTEDLRLRTGDYGLCFFAVETFPETSLLFEYNKTLFPIVVFQQIIVHFYFLFIHRYL